jgi:hypothetical protein
VLRGEARLEVGNRLKHAQQVSTGTPDRRSLVYTRGCQRLARLDQERR